MQQLLQVCKTQGQLMENPLKPLKLGLEDIHLKQANAKFGLPELKEADIREFQRSSSQVIIQSKIEKTYYQNLRKRILQRSKEGIDTLLAPKDFSHNLSETRDEARVDEEQEFRKYYKIDHEGVNLRMERYFSKYLKQVVKDRKEKQFQETKQDILARNHFHTMKKESKRFLKTFLQSHKKDSVFKEEILNKFDYIRNAIDDENFKNIYSDLQQAHTQQAQLRLLKIRKRLNIISKEEQEQIERKRNQTASKNRYKQMSVREVKDENISQIADLKAQTVQSLVKMNENKGLQLAIDKRNRYSRYVLKDIYVSPKDQHPLIFNETGEVKQASEFSEASQGGLTQSIANMRHPMAKYKNPRAVTVERKRLKHSRNSLMLMPKGRHQ